MDWLRYICTISLNANTHKSVKLPFKTALIMLVIDISLALIIHHLDIVDDNTTDYHYNTPYAYQFNTYMVRMYIIDVNYVPLYSTKTYNFVNNLYNSL